MHEQAADVISQLATVTVQTETGTGLDVTQPIRSQSPEKFIQVDREDIVRRVLGKIFEPGQRALATEVLRYVCALRQAESAKSLDKLIEHYDAFNPDDETVNLTELSAAGRREQLEALKAEVIDLVESANYIEVDQSRLAKNSRRGIGRRLFGGGRSLRIRLSPALLSRRDQRQSFYSELADALAVRTA